MLSRIPRLRPARVHRVPPWGAFHTTAARKKIFIPRLLLWGAVKVGKGASPPLPSHAALTPPFAPAAWLLLPNSARKRIAGAVSRLPGAQRFGHATPVVVLTAGGATVLLVGAGAEFHRVPVTQRMQLALFDAYVVEVVARTRALHRTAA